MTMMTFWRNRTFSTHQLTVFPDQSVTGGPWNTIFTDALQEFNLFSSSLNLGVTFVDARTLTPPLGPPDSNGIDGADVMFQAVNGPINFTLMGDPLLDPKTKKPCDLDGNGLHGLTLTPAFNFPREGGARIVKAIVAVPATPSDFAGPLGQKKRRPVGREVMRFIAVHELVHATGLHNAAHSPESIPDVFCGTPIMTPQFIAGATPDDDKIELKPPNKTSTGFIPGVYAPPNTMSARTAGLVTMLWVIGPIPKTLPVIPGRLGL
jgi:hypothetical protein